MTTSSFTRTPVFLESADSVRSADRSSASAEQALDQLGMEAVVALAFGRPLAIQRAYAFDSWALTRMLGELHDAMRESRTWDVLHPRPVRIHLFGAASFRDAVAATVTKLGSTGDEGFTSSLYPELAGTGLDAVAREVGTGNAGPLLDRLPADRRGSFEATWRWFAHTDQDDPAELVPDGSGGASLRTVLEPLWTEPDRVRRHAGHDGIDDSVVEGALEAFATLWRASGESETMLHSRSPLRSHQPWHDSGTTAGELLGTERLDLVLEVVDTVYNRVVVSSMSGVAPFYSTPLRPAAAATTLQGAQDLALSLTRFGSTRGRARQDIGAPRPASPAGELRFVGLAPEHWGEASRRLSAHRVAVFTEILSLCTTRSWRESLDTVEAELARCHGSADAAEAISRHLGLVGDSLGQVVEDPDRREGWRLRLDSGFSSAAGVALGGTGLLIDMSEPLTLALAVAGAVVGPFVTHHARAASRDEDGVARELARYVTTSGVEA